MKCPICSAWTLVKETRKRESNITVRRYECANLHTFRTTEQVTQIFDATHMEELKLTRIANLVKASKNRIRAPRKSKKASYA
jgi:transcriptional regulator NrdR family protein